MHKRKILYFREPEVHTVLLRQLSRKGYKIYPKVRLEDTIGNDPGEHLSESEFKFLSRAHLDFVVTKDDTAVFAVEFDGIHHLEDPMTMERDAIKNRLCKSADLPLLRIGSTEITSRDGETLLDYMLMRYVAWQEEIDEIRQEIAEYAAALPPTVDPEDVAVDLDPAVHFDLRHPFPGSQVVRERLWRNFRIVWDLETSRSSESPQYVCDVLAGRSGSLHRDQFHTNEVRASLWPAELGRENEIFTENVSVSVRAWLPLRPDVPKADDLGRLFSKMTREAAAEIVERFQIRAESMWFPSLPGISAWDVTEHYTEYLGFRAIERWAKANLRHTTK
jgi:hypothetical protein